MSDDNNETILVVGKSNYEGCFVDVQFITRLFMVKYFVQRKQSHTEVIRINCRRI